MVDFFFNDTATTEIYTLSLHDALPIWTRWQYLDDLARGHDYDLEFLICYGLKLKIHQRHQEYRSSKGHDVFDDMRTMEHPADWAVPSI